MPPAEIYIGIGSNLGDAQGHCRQALTALSRLPGLTITAISSLYATEPVQVEGEWFLNCVVGGVTTLSPMDLLQALQGIEREMGRPAVREKGAPRVIDLDILLYGSSVITTPELTVPHPRMHERRFVLEPLSEIAPQTRHPLLQVTVAELSAQVRDSHQVRRLPGPGIPLPRRENSCV